MSVMVYSRLGDVLRDKNMSVGDLARRIAERFGLEVDERSLDRLTRAISLSPSPPAPLPQGARGAGGRPLARGQGEGVGG